MSDHLNLRHISHTYFILRHRCHTSRLLEPEILKLLVFIINIIGFTITINEKSWAYFLFTLMTSLCLMRSRDVFQKKDPVYFYRIDIMILLVIFIYAFPTAYDILFGQNILSLRLSFLSDYLFLINMFLATFLLATKDLKSFSFSGIKNRNLGQRSYAAFALLLIFFGVSLYLYFLFAKIGGFGALIAMRRLDYYREIQGMGIFTAGLSFIRFGWIFLYIVHARSPNYKSLLLRHWIAIIIFAIFFLLQGERGIWVKLLVPIFFVHTLFFPIRLRTFFIILIVSIVFLQLFSKFRFALDHRTVTMYDMANRMDAKWLNMSSGETGAHYDISSDVLYDTRLNKPKYGTTYLNGFLNLVPTIVWPNRANAVELPHIKYMQLYYAEDLRRGAGRAYSIFIEAFINFWWFGPAIIGFAFGTIFKKLMNALGRTDLNSLKLTVMASLFSPLILIVRQPFAGLLKDLLISCFLPFAIMYLMILINKHLKS